MKRQIIIDGKTYEVEYDDAPANSSPAVPLTEPAQSIVLPTPPAPVSGADNIDESKVCRSPVAGIVARINVEAGQSVQAGAILLVVEAMKMESNLAVGSAAIIKVVRVKVGDTVKPREIVVEFE